MSTSTATHLPLASKRLSFLAFVEHTGVAQQDSTGQHRSAGLDAGLELFQLAEELGYETGYVRHRHLETYLSAPFPFLSAAAQRTSRIRLGTSVTPLRFEHPIRLAEDAATTDLLAGGRLELGLSSGYAASETTFAQAFGDIGDDVRAVVDARLAQFLAAVEGQSVATAETKLPFADAGDELRVHPQSPTLRDRIAYGAGGGRTARRTGELGLGLQLSTLNTEPGPGTFEETQADCIASYRDAHASTGRGRSFAAVSRAIVPYENDAEREELAFLLQRDLERAQPGGSDLGPSFQFGRVPQGSADRIADTLAADAGLAAADELVIALPFDYPPSTNRRILRHFAERVAPQLGFVRG